MTDTSATQLEDVLSAIASAGVDLAATTPTRRADLLRTAADALDADVQRLVPIAEEETRLPTARLEGEVARTTYQLRMLADLAAEGSCFDAVIEHADPEFPLGPRPDLRRVGVPIGPVLVFAASNFPFAFSVAGGDTGAALAAGCPVIVKAHPGHPQLSDRVGALLADAGAPVRVVHGVQTGRTALTDHRVKAAAFTGSIGGGRALFDLATSRSDPIPFYGELGSVNPVFVSPRAVEARGPEIVAGFVGSFTLGVGQFCTNPGLLFLPVGHGLEHTLVDALREVGPAPMLGDWVEDRYKQILGERRSRPEVSGVVNGHGTAPTLLATSAAAVSSNPALRDECFGPTSMIVEYLDDDDLLRAARSLEGALTATIHAEDDETDWARTLVAVLAQRAGRIVWNGWPTGVAVNPAMHHGGPWPATTAPLHSSVGGNTISRFLRPICYQGVPDALLAPSIRDANPLGLQRRVRN
jgi:NADP-dependent aldehyde dehydrogenase